MNIHIPPREGQLEPHPAAVPVATVKGQEDQLEGTAGVQPSYGYCPIVPHSLKFPGSLMLGLEGGGLEQTRSPAAFLLHFPWLLS